MIFKKKDPSLCDNYRPISILSIAYKIFASMLKERLLDAGLDARLWASQFGFRRERSTHDAVFVARRRIEVGDELTFDYETVEYECISVERCLCRAASCRGSLRGYRHSSEALRALPHGSWLAGYLLRDDERASRGT